MFSKQEYYSHIYKRLILEHCDWKMEKDDLESEVVMDRGLCSLLEQIYAVYGFDFRKNARINIVKFRIWRRELELPENDDSVYAATCFVLYCCLIDKILDSRRFSQTEKEILCEELMLLGNGKTKTRYYFPEIWILGAKTFDFLKGQPNDSFVRDEIKAKINRAFSSEIFLYKHPLVCFDKTMSLHSLIDKSVEFVSASFEITACDSDQTRVREIANLIGELFWLIDDICDLPSDIEDGSINSALMVCTDMSRNMSLNNRIEYAALHIENMIQKLERNDVLLSRLTGDEMCRFIRSELWNWTLDVRKKVEDTSY